MLSQYPGLVKSQKMQRTFQHQRQLALGRFLREGRTRGPGNPFLGAADAGPSSGLGSRCWSLLQSACWVGDLGIDVALVLLIAKVELWPIGTRCPSEGEFIPVEAPPFRFLPCPQRKLGTWSARAHSSDRKLNHRSLQASPSTRSGPPMFPQVSRAQPSGRQLAGRQCH